MDYEGIGLANNGNTCYVNAVVQCMFHSFLFRKQLFMNKELRLKKDRNQCILTCMRDMIGASHQSHDVINPRSFISLLAARFKDRMEIHEQNDAEEFFLLLIDQLFSDVTTKKVSPCPSEIDTMKIPSSLRKLMNAMEESWKKTNKDIHLELAKLSFGQTINQVKCTNKACGDINHNYECFSTLPINVVHLNNEVKDPMSIQELLSKSIDHELLEDWICDRCKAKRGLKSVKFWRLPDTLVISLKKYTHNLKKIRPHIRSIDTSIDLKEWTLYDRKSRYKLSSIVCHSGSYHYGHYYSICKIFSSERKEGWCLFNDHMKVAIDDINKYINDAYLLFYERD